MAGLSYMQRRSSGRYEFRKRLPGSLAGQPAPAHVKVAFPELVNPKTGCFKGELVRSLETTDYREAKRRDLREARKALDMFAAAERVLNGQAEGAAVSAASCSPDVDLAVIEAETVAELLSQDDAQRTHGDDRRRLQSREERAQWPDLVPIPEAWTRGMAEDHFIVYGDALEELAGEYRHALSRHDPGIVRAETDQAMRRHGVPIDRTSATYHEIGLVVLKGHVRAYDAMLRRQVGEVVETPALPSRGDKGPKLSEAFELWQQGSDAAGARRPTPRTLIEAEAAMRWFTELHGDMRLGNITKAHARDYQHAMARMPKRLSNKLRALPLPKLLERKLEGHEPRGAATINKTLTMLAAIVSYAKREGLLDAVPGYVNPFDKDVKLRVDKRTEEGRDLFEASDLAAIFGTGVFTEGDRPRAGAQEAAFWIPLIALLSGMRLEEIAGLRLQDLCQDEETRRWVFDINPRGGRSVKTASSIRKVPVHPELQRIGLLDYRQALIAQGKPLDSSLWPGLKSAEGRPLSAQWSKWFGRFIRDKAGITDRRKVFHSFRHTFKRMARDAGIPEELHDAMTGHAGGGGVGKSYGRGVSLRPLIEAMDRIAVPGGASMVVSGLAWRSNRAEGQGQ
jgi:integrase